MWRRRHTHQFKTDSAFIFNESEQRNLAWPLPFKLVHIISAPLRRIRATWIFSKRRIIFGDCACGTIVSHKNGLARSSQNKCSEYLRWRSRQFLFTHFCGALMSALSSHNVRCIFIWLATATTAVAADCRPFKLLRRMLLRGSYAAPMTSIYSILLDFVWQDITAF